MSCNKNQIHQYKLTQISIYSTQRLTSDKRRWYVTTPVLTFNLHLKKLHHTELGKACDAAMMCGEASRSINMNSWELLIAVSNNKM